MEGSRHALQAYIDLLHEPFQLARGLCPPDLPFFLRYFFIVQENVFLTALDDKIAYFEEKNGTMLPGVKNVARRWSSFVCSFSVDLFHGVL